MFDDLKGDIWNICILLVLYTLQEYFGIPIGISDSIPILLQQHHSSYSQQAMFSLCRYPYSMKMLWAPFVDSVYSDRVGRRKSWIVPLQLTIGIMLIMFASLIEETVFSSVPNIEFLTICFFIFYLLVATQDIAVDGWALSLLSEKNRGWASTCNAVGQTLGINIANSIFLALNDPHFLSNFRTTKGPLISLKQFLMFWGYMFIVVTLLIFFFVKENPPQEKKPKLKLTVKQLESEPLIRRRSPRTTPIALPSDDEERDALNTESEPVENSLSVGKIYQIYFSILKNPHFIQLALILLTNRIGVFPVEAASTLRLIDKGAKRVSLSSLKLIYFPLEMFITVVVSRILRVIHPLKLFLRCYLCRITMAVIFGCFIHYLPDANEDMMDNKYYPIVFLMIIGSNIFSQAMFICSMTFFAQISDPHFGGTYMSLFNTVSNLGNNLYISPSLSLIDAMSKKVCLKNNEIVMSSCVSKMSFNQCVFLGGKCQTDRDGFYALVWPSYIYGLLWTLIFRRFFSTLQGLKSSDWWAI